MRTTLALAVALLTACDKTVATPPGSLLDVPSFTKTSVSDWTIGAPKGPTTKVKKKYRYSGDLGPDVRFEIAFEHGPSELVTAKPKTEAPPLVETPRAIHFELLENKTWAAHAKCDDDLKVPLAVNADGTSAYPKSVWATCSLVLKRKNGDITTAPVIDIHGDGKLQLTAIGSGDRVVEE